MDVDADINLGTATTDDSRECSSTRVFVCAHCAGMFCRVCMGSYLGDGGAVEIDAGLRRYCDGPGCIAAEARATGAIPDEVAAYHARLYLGHRGVLVTKLQLDRLARSGPEPLRSVARVALDADASPASVLHARDACASSLGLSFDDPPHREFANLPDADIVSAYIWAFWRLRSLAEYCHPHETVPRRALEVQEMRDRSDRLWSRMTTAERSRTIVFLREAEERRSEVGFFELHRLRRLARPG